MFWSSQGNNLNANCYAIANREEALLKLPATTTTAPTTTTTATPIAILDENHNIIVTNYSAVQQHQQQQIQHQRHGHHMFMPNEGENHSMISNTKTKIVPKNLTGKLNLNALTHGKTLKTPIALTKELLDNGTFTLAPTAVGVAAADGEEEDKQKSPTTLRTTMVKMPTTSKYVFVQQNTNGRYTAVTDSPQAVVVSGSGGVGAGAGAGAGGGNKSTTPATSIANGMSNILLLATKTIENDAAVDVATSKLNMVGATTANVVSLVGGSGGGNAGGSNDEDLRPLTWLNSSDLIKDINAKRNLNANATISTSSGNTIIGGTNFCIVNAAGSSSAHELIEELPHHVAGEEHVVATTLPTSASAIGAGDGGGGEAQIACISVGVGDYQQQFIEDNRKRASHKFTTTIPTSTNVMEITAVPCEATPQGKIFTNSTTPQSGSIAVGAPTTTTTTVHVGPSGTTTVVQYKSNNNYILTTTQPQRQQQHAIGNINNNIVTFNSNTSGSGSASGTNQLTSNALLTLAAASSSASTKGGTPITTTPMLTAMTTPTKFKQLSVTTTTTGAATNFTTNGNNSTNNNHINGENTIAVISNNAATLHKAAQPPSQQQQHQQQHKVINLNRNNVIVAGASGGGGGGGGGSSGSTTIHHPHKKYLREKMNVLTTTTDASTTERNFNLMNATVIVTTTNASTTTTSTATTTASTPSTTTISIVASPTSSCNSSASTSSTLSSTSSTGAINGGNSPTTIKQTFYQPIHHQNNHNHSNHPVALNMEIENGAAAGGGALTMQYSPLKVGVTRANPMTVFVSTPTAKMNAPNLNTSNTNTTNTTTTNATAAVLLNQQVPDVIMTPEMMQHNTIVTQLLVQQQPSRPLRSPTSTYSSYDNDSLKDFEMLSTTSTPTQHQQLQQQQQQYNQNITIVATSDCDRVSSSSAASSPTSTSTAATATPGAASAQAALNAKSNGIHATAVSSSAATQKQKHPTNVPYDPQVHTNNKPPYSFSSLIFMAIDGSHEKALPVKEIYAWIVQHFPYFKTAPTGWKNSVRHNLSLNKSFVKVEKAPNMGKGSLWRVEQQQRHNLIQALTRAPLFPNAGAGSAGAVAESGDKTPLKNGNGRNLNHNNGDIDNDEDGDDIEAHYDVVDCANVIVNQNQNNQSNHRDHRFDPRFYPNLSKAFKNMSANGELSALIGDNVIAHNNNINTNNNNDDTDGDVVDAGVLIPSDYSTTNYRSNNIINIYNNNKNNNSNKNSKLCNKNGTVAAGIRMINANELTATNASPPSGPQMPTNAHQMLMLDVVSIERLARDCGADNIDDVNAAAAMLALKHGPKVFTESFHNGSPIITSSPSEDHTYSAGGSGASTPHGVSSNSSCLSISGNNSLNNSNHNLQSSIIIGASNISHNGIVYGGGGSSDVQSNCGASSSDAAYESSEENYNNRSSTQIELDSDQQRHRDGVDALLSLSTSCTPPMKRPLSASMQNSDADDAEDDERYTVTNSKQPRRQHFHYHGNDGKLINTITTATTPGATTSTTAMILDEGYNTQCYFGSPPVVNAVNSNRATNSLHQSQQQQQQQLALLQRNNTTPPTAMTTGSTTTATAAAAAKRSKLCRNLRPKFKRKTPWTR